MRPPTQSVEEELRAAIVCPRCHGQPAWSEHRIACGSCRAEYRIQDGIPLLIVPESDARDLWEQAESGLARALREDPELERALFQTAPQDLAPADAFLRALVLEERGDPGEVEPALRRLYSDEVLACMNAQRDALCEFVPKDALVVDFATGRGMLLEQLQQVASRLVATDVSPRVLRRAVARGVSSIACDARRLPFRDRSLACVTTFAGLNSVERPGELLAELRRVARRLLAVHQLFERGSPNDARLVELGLDELAYREPFLRELERCGWDAQIVSECHVTAEPTPVGVLLQGAVIDGLPVAPVEAQWVVVDAS